ncbi:unnamed protein product [Sphagnum jensenii]
MSKNGELDVPHPQAWAWGCPSLGLEMSKPGDDGCPTSPSLGLGMSKHGDDGCPTSPCLDIRTWGCGNRDLELRANGGNDMFGHISLWN